MSDPENTTEQTGPQRSSDETPYGYVGPSATILHFLGNVAPGTALKRSDLTDDEFEHFDREGWLDEIRDDEEREPTLAGDALKQRAAELEIEGRASMNADELRAAVAEAEAEGEAS